MTHNVSLLDYIMFDVFLGKIQKAIKQQMPKTLTEVVNVTGCLLMNNIRPSVRKKK